MNATPRSVQLNKRAVGGGVAIALLLGAGLLAYRHFGAAPETQHEPETQAPAGTFRPTKDQLASLDIEPVKAIAFRNEQVTDGQIATNDDTSTPVFSPFSGRVAKVFGKLGDLVQAGTPLMAVEASEYVQGQNDVVAAAAGVTSAKAQVELAQTTERRVHDLYLAKSAAMKDWLQSQADLVAAQSNLRSAETALAAARSRLKILGKTDEEIAAIEATKPASGARPEALVRAPIAGTVVQRQVGVGQYIQSAANGAANQQFSIADLRTVWLVANVREADASKVRVGQEIEVRALALPKRVFKAKLNWVAPTIDPSTRRLAVRAVIDNADGALKPMMYASFTVVTGDQTTTVGVPQKAVVYEGSKTHVFVQRPDGLLAIQPVRIGRSSSGLVEIEEGLKAGDKVVTRGALFIDRATEAK